MLRGAGSRYCHVGQDGAARGGRHAASHACQPAERASCGGRVLHAALTDAAPLKTAVTPTQTPNLFFLDVEPNIPNPADIISSKRYQKLVATLEDSYDYVIYDMPPVGTFVDAAILSTLVDGTVLVVKPGSTKRSELVDACEQLKKADANILGICATFCEGTGSEYYYAYYTKDGGRLKDDGDVAALQA